MLRNAINAVAKWFGDGLRLGSLYGSNDAWIDEVTPGWVMHDLMRVQRTNSGTANVGETAMSLPAHLRPTPRRNGKEKRLELRHAPLPATVPQRHGLRARNR